MVILISQRRKLRLTAVSDLIEIKLLARHCQQEFQSRLSVFKTSGGGGTDMPAVNVSPLRQRPAFCSIAPSVTGRTQVGWCGELAPALSVHV